MTDQPQEVALPAPDELGPAATVTSSQVRDLLAGLGDPERAHVLEDDLCRAVLRAIRDGHPQPVELAAAMLDVCEAERTRWHA